MIEFLTIVTALMIIFGLVVLIAVCRAFWTGQVEEYRKQHWQKMLEIAQKETGIDDH